MPKGFSFHNDLDDLFHDEHARGMQCDIYEKDGNCYIEADVPGFSKEDISIELEDGYLTITANKNSDSENSDVNYIRRERVSKQISRSFYLGTVDESNIKAEFKDGILKLCIPQYRERENKKHITIE